MKILIIGGTGVLSTSVTQEALRKGIAVTMINRGNNLNRIPKGAELIIADKNDTRLIKEKLADRFFDAVIDFLCFNQTELEKSFNVYSHYTKQYFFISTAGVYNTSIPGPCKEDHPKVQREWEYSVNKWASEERLMELAKNSETNYTIVRPMVTYDDTRIPYGIAPYYGFHWTFVERILHNKPIISWNHGENRCNMMRVEDFAVGVVALINNPNAYGEAFNICGDETPSYREVMETVGRLVNHSVVFIDIDPQFYAEEDPGHKGELLGGRAIDFIIDNSKVKRIAPDFKQTIFINEGIKKTLEVYIKNNNKKRISWIYDADTDRIVRKWCNLKKIDYRQYNLGFKDYLGNATLKDRLIYYLRYNSNKLPVRICMKILKNLHRVR